MAGMGYVGLSNAALLTRDNPVCAVDIQSRKVDKVNRGRLPTADPRLESRLGEKGLTLSATTDIRAACRDADFMIIATPTDYDVGQDYFDTPPVEVVVEVALRIRPDACIVIRSAVPLGFTKEISSRYPDECTLFSPELLREGRALYNNLYPSRIILGPDTEDPVQMEKARMFTSFLKRAALRENVPVRYIDTAEAEAVKLLSSTYLAVRVASSNELDTYAEIYGSNTRNVIEGVCLDPRIGTHYNDPPFGYGGYCLPEDTKQLLINYGDILNCIMTVIVQANQTRKGFIAGQVLSRSPRVAGIYRLTMKADSDDFRHSSVLGIMRRLEKEDIKVITYEPALKAGAFLGTEIISDLEEFKQGPDVILADRYSRQPEDIRDKVYTKDLSPCD